MSMRTDSQEEKGFEAGEANGTLGFRRLDPGWPGSVLSGMWKGSP